MCPTHLTLIDLITLTMVICFHPPFTSSFLYSNILFSTLFSDVLQTTEMGSGTTAVVKKTQSKSDQMKQMLKEEVRILERTWLMKCLLQCINLFAVIFSYN